jgi:hypothetical protein
MMTEAKPYAPEPQTAYSLAADADCACPDGLESPGAQFLLGVQSAVVESVNWAVEHDEWTGDQDGWEDAAHEIADGAVPVYTGELWAVFVDLAAWQEDDGDLIVDTSDGTDAMTKGAQVRLYEIAHRLAHHLFHEAESDPALDAAREDEEEDESPSAVKEDGRNEWLAGDEG